MNKLTKIEKFVLNEVKNGAFNTTSKFIKNFKTLKIKDAMNSLCKKRILYVNGNDIEIVK
jgi:hypothetical protein